MCTTIVTGSQATADGSILMMRSADSSSLKAQHFVIHPAHDNPEGAMYRTKDYQGATAFEYPLPEHSLRYTTAPNWKTQLHGAVGFNELGVGITGTESIFARDDALVFDPLNKVNGITEDDICEVVLCRAKTAREGIQILGSIIETIGAAEGFGIGVCDANELWYIETGTAHQWLAVKINETEYFASANQGRLRVYEKGNPDMMASANLVEFATEKGLYNPAEGDFDFAKAYIRNDDRDRTYNDPRVWAIHQRLNPSLVQDPHDGRNYPVFLVPEKKITVDDLKAVLREHFEGTEHDPYMNGLGGKEPWRPVSVFRTYEGHVLQSRPWLPKEVGNVIYIAWGMCDLSVFLPFYHGLEKVPVNYGMGTDKADNVSAYWKFRKVQTLAMTDYAALAPIVKKAYTDFEANLAARMSVMEAKYMELVHSDKQAAQALLNSFNLQVLAEADALADSLLNELFTARTLSVEMANRFTNRKNKD